MKVYAHFKMSSKVIYRKNASHRRVPNSSVSWSTSGGEDSDSFYQFKSQVNSDRVRDDDKSPRCSGTSFKVFNYDVRHNDVTRRRFLITKDPEFVQDFRGKTLIPKLDLVIPFPVFLDERSVVCALRRYITLTGCEPRFHKLDDKLMELCLVLMNPRLDSLASVGLPSLFPAWDLCVDNPLLGVGVVAYVLWLAGPQFIGGLLAYVLYSTCVRSVIDTFCEGHVSKIHIVVVLPILEEILKTYFISSDLFGMFEFYGRLTPTAMLPCLMHVSVSGLPFLTRLTFHALWNLMASYFSPDNLRSHMFGADLGVDFRSFGEIAYDIDLVKSIYEKDYAGVLLKLVNFDVIHEGRLANFCSILGISGFDSISDLDKFFCNGVVKTHSDDYIQGLNPNVTEEKLVVGVEERMNRIVSQNGFEDVVFLAGNEKINFLEKFASKFLPKALTVSMLYRRIVAFVMAVCASRWFTSVVQLDFFSFVPDEGKEIIEATIDLVVAFYKSVKLFIKTGSWDAFFLPPADVQFENYVTNLEEAVLAGDSVDLKATIQEAKEIASARLLVFNTSRMDRMRDRLTTRIRYMERMLKSQQERRPPFPVILTGPPGTGKTSLTSSLAGIVANVHEEQRFSGDIINIYTEVKHPVEAPHSEKATVALLNDVKANHCETASSGQLTLSDYLQTIIDTNTLVFPSATIEGKSNTYSDLRLVVISTNAASWKFKDDAERLERRINSGIIADVVVVDEDGRIASYDTYKKWPPAKRNELTRFRIRKGMANGNHFSFGVTDTTLSTVEFLRHFERSYREHLVATALNATLFSRTASCSCGANICLHMCQYDDINDEIVDQSLAHRPETFCMINRDCDYRLAGPVYAVRRLEVMTSGAVDLFSYASLNYVRVYPVIFCVILLLLTSSLDGAGVALVSLWLILTSAYITLKHFESIADDIRVSRTVLAIADYAPDGVWKMKLKAYMNFCSLRRFFRQHAQSIALLSAGAVVIALYLRKRSKLVETGNVFVVTKDNVEGASLDVGVVTREQSFTTAATRDWGSGNHYSSVLLTKGTSKEDLIRMCKNNSHMVTFYFGNKSMDSKIFLLDSTRFLFNYHYLNAINHVGSFQVQLAGTLYRFDQHDWYRAEGSELCVCYHNFNVHVHDVKKFLVSGHISHGVAATIVRDDMKDGVATAVHQNFAGQDVVCYIIKAIVVKGECTTPLIGSFTGGYGLIGFMSYGLPDASGNLVVGGFSCFLKGSIRQTRDEMPTLILPTQGIIKPASIHHCFRATDDPSLIMLGDTGTKCGKFKSKITRSVVYDYFSPRLTKEYTWPTVLRKVVTSPDGTQIFKSSILETLSIKHDRKMLTRKQLRDASTVYLNDLGLATLRASPLSLSDAILGLSEAGIGRIPFNTSCGPVYSSLGLRTKHDLFSEIDGKFVALPVVKEDILDILKRMDNDEIYYLIVKYAAKDEVKSVAKIENCEIRHFGVVHLPPNLVVRMYLMPLVTILLSCPPRSECYGSINAGSTEWNSLANDLFLENFKLIDMDFKKFDRCHMLDVLREAAHFFREMALRVGYTEIEAKRVYYSTLMVCQHLVLYQSDIGLEIGHLVSGFLLTLIINSFINSMLLRCAFAEITLKPVSEFRRYVRTATVGDDNLSAISNDISDVFNVVTIAEVYKQYGYKVTNADKSSELKPFVERCDAVFLKRKFRYSEETGTYMAPIETDSIYKALCFDKLDSQSESSISRLVGIGNGAQREFFLHGRAAFESFKKDLLYLKEERGIPFELLDYDSLMGEYWAKEFRTFAL